MYAVVGYNLESEISCEIEEHCTTIRNRLMNITFECLVMNFTKSVNRFLRGNSVDVEPTNNIEQEAKMLYKKKKNIGKYCPKVEVSDNDASTNYVANVHDIEKDVKGKSAKAKSCDIKKHKSVIPIALKATSNIKIAKNKSEIKKMAKVIKESANKNFSVHGMQLRKKNNF